MKAVRTPRTCLPQAGSKLRLWFRVVGRYTCLPAGRSVSSVAKKLFPLSPFSLNFRAFRLSSEASAKADAFRGRKYLDAIALAVGLQAGYSISHQGAGLPAVGRRSVSACCNRCIVRLGPSVSPRARRPRRWEDEARRALSIFPDRCSRDTPIPLRSV